MSVVLVRVDSRLFHGQILEGWIPSTGTTMVIVADNNAAANPLQKRVMEMAASENVKIRVESIDDAVDDIEHDRFPRESIMILFSSPHDALEAYQKGIRYQSINLGNLNYTSGREQVTPCIALGDDDVDCLKELAKKGIDIDIRGVPRERPKGIEDLFRNYFKICRSRD